MGGALGWPFGKIGKYSIRTYQSKPSLTSNGGYIVDFELDWYIKDDIQGDINTVISSSFICDTAEEYIEMLKGLNELKQYVNSNAEWDPSFNRKFCYKFIDTVKSKEDAINRHLIETFPLKYRHKNVPLTFLPDER